MVVEASHPFIPSPPTLLGVAVVAIAFHQAPPSHLSSSWVGVSAGRWTASAECGIKSELFLQLN